jgi:signal transduction histidine kinase
MRRGVLVALGVAAVALGGVYMWLVLREGTDAGRVWEATLSMLVGLSFVGAGLVAWWLWPDNRTGPLMTLVGFLWRIGQLEFVFDPAWVHDVGAWVRPLHIAVFAHLLLAFPTGRLGSNAVRALVVAVYLDVGLLNNAPELVDDDALAADLYDLSFGVAAVLYLLVIGVLVERWRTGSRAWRRTVAPLLWPGSVATALIVVFAVSEVLDHPLGDAPGLIFRLAFLVIPFAFLAGLLRSRLARASVAELVVELGQAGPSGPASLDAVVLAAIELRDALARALGDPSLNLAYWLPDEERFVDLSGQPVALPEPGEPRMATIVEREGDRVAALVHDEALSHDPELLRAVSAAAGLALENERLQAQLRARLAELRASRARIVQAGDLERKRIERNLHDATQQRLTSIAMALGIAESKLGADPEAAGAILHQAREGLAVALAELRDLSQGIHPGILTERGLGTAIEDLAYSAPIPITVSSDLRERLPEQLEAGAYYVVAEALANVAKHAEASSAAVTLSKRNGKLVLSVRDDGVGGADPQHGSGLRGLADRVQALGGTLVLDSEPGRGTVLEAEIPCA